MKTLYIILFLQFFSLSLFGDFLAPDPKPNLAIRDAIKKAEQYAEKNSWADDAYVSNVALVQDDEGYLWIVWLASPTRAFLILEVDLKGDVTRAERERLQKFFPSRPSRTNPVSQIPNHTVQETGTLPSDE